eukprot:TRINITY_DN2806_c0_g1_i3.p1 TRINITY_DN2806_c0_g1~~TRINITY_DN2806_c0_g1_i3.p1  ORF type:complete len:959 (-),score=194.80 TRINITY_DN2806_c0_g1_i3:138-3014(-)
MFNFMVLLLFSWLLANVWAASVDIGLFIQTDSTRYWQVNKVQQLAVKEVEEQIEDYKAELKFNVAFVEEEEELFHNHYDLVLFATFEAPLSYECRECTSGSMLLPFSIASTDVSLVLKRLLNALDWKHLTFVYCESRICNSIFETFKESTETDENIVLEVSTETNSESEPNISGIMSKNSKVLVSLGTADYQQQLIIAFLEYDPLMRPSFIFVMDSCANLLEPTKWCDIDCLTSFPAFLEGSICIDQPWVTSDEFMQEVWNPVSGRNQLSTAEKIGSGLMNWQGQNMDSAVPVVWDAILFALKIMKYHCDLNGNDEELDKCISEQFADSVEFLEKTYSTPFDGIVVSNICEKSFLLPLSASFFHNGNNAGLDGNYSMDNEWTRFTTLSSCNSEITQAEIDEIVWKDKGTPKPNDREYVMRDPFVWKVEIVFHVTGLIVLVTTIFGVVKNRATYIRASNVCICGYEDYRMFLLVIGFILLLNFVVLCFSSVPSPTACLLRSVVPWLEIIFPIIYSSLLLRSFYMIVFNKSLHKRTPTGPKKKALMALSIWAVVALWRIIYLERNSIPSDPISSCSDSQILQTQSSELRSSFWRLKASMLYAVPSEDALTYDRYCLFAEDPFPELKVLCMCFVVGASLRMVSTLWFKEKFMKATKRYVNMLVYVSHAIFIFMVLFLSTMALSDPSTDDYPRTFALIIEALIRFLYITVVPAMLVWGEIYFSWKKSIKKERMKAIAKRELVPKKLFPTSDESSSELDKRFNFINSRMISTALSSLSTADPSVPSRSQTQSMADMFNLAALIRMQKEQLQLPNPNDNDNNNQQQNNEGVIGYNNFVKGSQNNAPSPAPAQRKNASCVSSVASCDSEAWLEMVIHEDTQAFANKFFALPVVEQVFMANAFKDSIRALKQKWISQKVSLVQIEEKLSDFISRFEFMALRLKRIGNTNRNRSGDRCQKEECEKRK